MSEQRKPVISKTQVYLLVSFAGAIAMTIVAPIDRLMTVLQTGGENLKNRRINSPYKGVIDCAKRIIKNEGFFQLWRGNVIRIARFFPSEFIKRNANYRFQKLFALEKDKHGMFPQFLSNIAAGAATGATHLLLVYPFDYAMVRMASDVIEGRQRQFSGALDVWKQTLAFEGVPSVYRGLGASFFGRIVFGAAHFGWYQSIKPSIPKTEDGKANLPPLLLVGYLANLSALALSYPFEVVSRRMMVSSMERYKYSSTWDAFRTILAKEGNTAFYKGFGIRFITTGIAGAVLLVGGDILMNVVNEAKQKREEQNRRK